MASPRSLVVDETCPATRAGKGGRNEQERISGCARPPRGAVWWRRGRVLDAARLATGRIEAGAGAGAYARELPEVDRVAVRVVIDCYQIAVAPSGGRRGNVEIIASVGRSARQPPGKALVSEFGLSMHVRSRGHDGAYPADASWTLATRHRR